MFIEEMIQSNEIRDDYQDLERIVWSFVSRRFTSWTFRPLCKCDEKGNTVKGSRQRCPFAQFVY